MSILITILIHFLARIDHLERVLPATADKAHAVVAAKYETKLYPGELLFGVVYTESDFELDLYRKHPGYYVCGTTQIKVGTWTECQAMFDIDAAYAAAVHALYEWRRICRAHRPGSKHPWSYANDLTWCSLYRYGGAYKKSYPGRVLKRAALYRQRVAGADS